ncbi:hypothetical protein DB354_10670 [Opitutus sp. ER46]|nr:hypothetical protein DB354_10670 [Opitutus sp. ER46]
MNEKNFAYERLRSDLLWPAVDKAIKNLVANGDLIEQTDRDHIVGYLVKVLRASVGSVPKKKTGKGLSRRSSRGRLRR